MDYLPLYSIYKPNTKGTGSAAQFSLSAKRDDKGNESWIIFLNMGKQDKNDPKNSEMDWGNTKIIMKLGMIDLQKIIHTLDLKKTQQKNKEMVIACDLFHKSKKGSTILNLKLNKNPYPGFYMIVSQQFDGQEKKQVGLSISPDESTGLKIVLERAFLKMLQW